MNEITEQQMANISGGGKFWATRWQCEKWVQVLLADVARFTIVYGVKATVDGITA